MNEFPQFISFGEALTDLIRRDGDTWVSVPGGAPWNVARVMACFGISSAFGGAISRDCFGDALWQASEPANTSGGGRDHSQGAVSNPATAS